MSLKAVLILADVLEVLGRVAIVYMWVFIICAALIAEWWMVAKFGFYLFGWGFAVVLARWLQAKTKELIAMERQDELT